MKFKGLTKLALSGVALAAVAATLGTSTYAWYVSNSTATVTGVSGTSAGSTSGNLLLCQLKEDSTSKVISEDGSWGNKLESVTLKATPNLNPVTKDTTGEGGIAPSENATGWHDKKNAPVAATDAYGYYAFAIYATDTTTVNMTLGAANTTASNAFTGQTAYNTAGTGSIGVNNKFAVDVLEALRVEVFQAQLTDEVTLATATASTNTKLTTNPADNFVASSDMASPYASPTSSVTLLNGGDAHAYYSAIMGENPAGGTTAATNTSLTNGVLALNLAQVSNAYVKYVIVLRYWLEGTDADCFDSCGGQTFSMKLGFEAVSSTGA